MNPAQLVGLEALPDDESLRMQLEADVLLLSALIGDRVLSRPHLVALLGDDVLERVRDMYLLEHAGSI